MLPKRFLLLITLSVVALSGVLPGVAQDMTYNESPMLAELVAAGELPPVEERLPANPLVVEPLEEIGTYGGTLRRGSANASSYLTENFTREPLTMWQMPLPSAGPPLPNLAESWEYNDAGTEVTVHLRQGVKWSDGTPFTSEDIEFYWFDIMLNENVTEAVPGILRVNGQVPELEIIDDYTIKYTFPVPWYFFAEAHASTWEMAWPKHFMSQFHPDYNENATYEDLNANLELINGRGAVTLQAWIMEEFVPGEIIRYVRNPYYFKVDPAGNQLPYFDRAEIQLVEDRQAVALGNITGQFDLDAMWVGVQHIQLFTQAIQDGRDVDIGFAFTIAMAQYFNLDHPDPVKRAAFRDANFRRAWSMAINRDELDNVLYSGLLEPTGTSFQPDSPYFTEDTRMLWAEYDPDGARTLLDEAGYLDVNGDGFRESPDGQPLEVVVDVGQHDLYTPSVEIIVESLADVGIRAVMNVRDQSLIRENFIAGDFDVHSWDFGGADTPLSGDIGLMAGAGTNNPPWHRNWQEDPVSDDFLRYNEIILSAASMPFEERVAAMQEAGRLLADNVWIANVGFYNRPFIVSNRLGNATRVIARNGEVNDMPPFAAYQLFEKYPSAATGG
jgi:peptide/nickel transport system substrate-binding protein